MMMMMMMRIRMVTDTFKVENFLKQRIFFRCHLCCPNWLLCILIDCSPLVSQSHLLQCCYYVQLKMLLLSWMQKRYNNEQWQQWRCWWVEAFWQRRQECLWPAEDQALASQKLNVFFVNFLSLFFISFTPYCRITVLLF